MTLNDKEQAVYQGISNLELRKLRSGAVMPRTMVMKEISSLSSERDL